MKLSIITINYNDAKGLKKTMESVLAQTSKEFEYIVVDGGSADGSKELIERLAVNDKRLTKWVSEKDSGIYNAMNKGIRMAKGEYVQFLNSGDILVNPQVVEKMLFQLSTFNFQLSILYGNMLKPIGKKILCDKGFAGRQPTMIDFFTGTLNHSPAYIKKELFEKYGFYDETLRIVSDWKWYLQVIIMGGEQIIYTDIDVTLFDMNGISTVNKDLDKGERKMVLESLFPSKVLADYERYTFPIQQWERLQRFPLIAKCVWLIERVLFKWEKWKFK